MITLAGECLVFQMPSGEQVPYSAATVSVELVGGAAERFDSEFVLDAAKAVFHYFKHEQGRDKVTVSEFAEALEQVLGGFAPPPATVPAGPPEADLNRLARESGHGCELFFYSRLRSELRRQVRQTPGVVRFSGLRDCVKQLAGTRRWGARCRTLEEQIICFLQECICAETRFGQCSLVVK